VLGVGGVFVALTQYDAAETRAKIAKEKLEQADSSLKRANQELAAAEASLVKAKEEESAAKQAKEEAIESKHAAEEFVKNLKGIVEERTAKAEAINPNSIENKLVYIQFQGSISRDLINELRSNLISLGYSAPGAERVPGNYKPSIKYFSKSEKDKADTLAKKIELFFTGKRCPIEIHTEYVTQISTTHALEAWIPHKCQ
jgi:hypothetical protein